MASGGRDWGGAGAGGGGAVGDDSRMDGASTIPGVLVAQARRHGGTLAVIGADATLTYAQLRDRALEVTRAAMAAGLGPGDRVGVWGPNSARWIVAALGLLGAGVTLVPLGSRLRAGEAADLLARTEARALFTSSALEGGAAPDLALTVHMDRQWDEFLAAAADTPVRAARRRMLDIDPDSVGDILFTSGTTGVPKGVPASHRRTLAVYRRWADAVTLRRGDRYLLVNPFSHTFGYKAGIVASLLRGATMAPVARFDPAEALRLIARHRISVLTGPPTLFGDLLDLGPTDADLSSLRLAGTGGCPVPADLVERIRTELGVPGVFTGYGLTESLGVVSVCPPGAPADDAAGMAGRPLTGVEVRILDPSGLPLPPQASGQIAVSHSHPDEPADNETWLHTGDLGFMDTQGRLHVTGRLKEVIQVGGFTVAPAEVEAVLRGHPEVRDVAVVGVPDARLGEIPLAYVEPRGDTCDPAAILAWARRRLADYKSPRAVRVRAALPRTPSGKVAKRLLIPHGSGDPA